MTSPSRPGVPTSLGNHEARIRALERQHQIGHRMPFISLQGVSLNGFTAVNNADSYPPLSGLEVVPGVGGSVDDAVFGGIDAGGGQVDIMTGGVSNEPFKAVEILQPGLYLYEFAIGWYLNWGAVRVNYDVIHTGGTVSNFRRYINGTENSYFGLNTDASAPQILVTARSLLAVDEDATDVQVRGFVHNHSGVSRTYGTTALVNVGTCSLWIVQLSASGDSNP